MNEDLMVPRELLENLSTMELDTTPRSIRLQDELRALLSDKPQATRCPNCGYLTSEREHLGCLRKAVSDLNAATGGQPQASVAQSAQWPTTPGLSARPSDDEPEVQRLREALASAEKNERHRNNSETRYWCDQYKQLARAALAASTGQEV